MITSLILSTNTLYTPEGVYCEIYPLLEGNTEEFNFNIPYLSPFQARLLISWSVEDNTDICPSLMEIPLASGSLPGDWSSSCGQNPSSWPQAGN